MNEARRRAFIYGCGGHGRSVLDVVECQGSYEVVAFLDDHWDGSSFLGRPVLGGRDDLPQLRGRGVGEGLVAIGHNETRAQLTTLLEESGLRTVSAIHPAAVVSGRAEVGAGTVAMAGTVVNTGAVVGAGVILNTGCSVDHDCRVGDYAHLSPGARLGGAATIGHGAHVGIAACVSDGIRVGDRATVGAGAVVLRDLPDGIVAAGVPARAL